MSAPVLSRLFHALKTRAALPKQYDLPKTHSQRAGRPQRTVDSQHSPTDSQRTFRPNPQSQSLSRGYGSILPTSLIYIVLSTRGCTPWRPEAVMSTTRSVNKSFHWVFTGRRERTGQCKRDTALPTTSPYRRAIRFQGQATLLKRKENSSQDSRQRPQFQLCYHSLSTFWFGNINPIPFR